MHRITIYSRPGCHLCEDAKKSITALVANHADVLIEEINIAKNPELLAKYHDDIPVIFVDDVERFRHTVDPDALTHLFYDEFGERLLGF